MKRASVGNSLVNFMLMAMLVLGADCGSIKAGPGKLQVTNDTMNSSSNQPAQGDEYDKALALAAKLRAEKMQGIQRPSEFPFPNVYGEPLHPSPCWVNFYSVNDHYPDYLLCEYDVDETNYNQSIESKWFGDALAQIRRYGTKKFPPVKWVAVIIKNRAEHKGGSTFEQSFKVGAIFKAADVFDASHEFPGLIASASMDRHPFLFDQTRPSLFPVEQQRWIIVERHAATNSPAAKTN